MAAISGEGHGLKASVLCNYMERTERQRRIIVMLIEDLARLRAELDARDNPADFEARLQRVEEYAEATLQA